MDGVSKSLNPLQRTLYHEAKSEGPNFRIVYLAAGEGSRMGYRPKPLQNVGGQMIGSWMLELASEQLKVPSDVIVGGMHASSVTDELKDAYAQITENAGLRFIQQGDSPEHGLANVSAFEWIQHVRLMDAFFDSVGWKKKDYDPVIDWRLDDGCREERPEDYARKAITLQTAPALLYLPMDSLTQLSAIESTMAAFQNRYPSSMGLSDPRILQEKVPVFTVTKCNYSKLVPRLDRFIDFKGDYMQMSLGVGTGGVLVDGHAPSIVALDSAPGGNYLLERKNDDLFVTVDSSGRFPNVASGLVHNLSTSADEFEPSFNLVDLFKFYKGSRVLETNASRLNFNTLEDVYCHGKLNVEQFLYGLPPDNVGSNALLTETQRDLVMKDISKFGELLSPLKGHGISQRIRKTSGLKDSVLDVLRLNNLDTIDLSD